MRDSFFWRCIAVMAILGLFYVGSGLNSDNPQLPSFVQTAKANGVAVGGKPSTGEYVVTSSPDGRTVYYFGARVLQPLFRGETFLGKLSATGVLLDESELKVKMKVEK